MKKLKLAAMAAACVAVMSGCSEDRYEDPRPVAEEGDVVQFGLDLGAQSRTMYGPETEVNGTTVQSIFWGNYVAGKTESIRVFCNESPAGRNIATYEVNLQDENSNIAAGINCTSGQAIQWGSQETGYTFYAIYPADRAEETLNGTTLTVTVNNGQTPVNYGPDGTTVNNELVTNPNPSTTLATPVTIYGNPDMSNALMYARTVTDRTSDPVGLQFNVLTDVLEVTVNGPEKDNELINGHPAPYIEIRGLNIESKSGSALGGHFNVDLETGKYSGNPTYPVRTLHMNTAVVQNNTVYYPKLYWRESGYDKLKVRFFLWPGVEASDLRVEVDTNYGQFTLEDLKGTFEAGKIHKLSLPHFKTPGVKFNLSKWMEVLDPNIYISELSIPGAFHAANPVFQTQAEFNSMYEAGVRAFEVQASVQNGVATVATGSDGTSRTLEDVIRTVGEKMAGAGTDSENAKTGFVYFLIGDPYNSSEFPSAVSAAITACEKYIYQDEIGPNTTLGEVRGKIVIKLNTNGADVNESGWPANFPALFTRWKWIKVGEALNVAMQWGAPIAPDVQPGPMRWCYNEQAQVNNAHLTGATGVNAAISAIEKAVDEVSAASLEAYKNEGAEHNVFYLTTIGGFYTPTYIEPYKATKAMSEPFAEALNPYMLTKLMDPSREPSPTGIVLMNFCCGTTSDANAYSSQDLIRAIVYNNNTFIMKRKPAN